MRYLVVLLVLWISISTSRAQSGDKYRSSYWLKYNNELSIGDKWLFIAEGENRRTFSPDRQNQVLARATVSHQVNKLLYFGVGFAFSTEYDADAELWVPEWRPHEQVELILLRKRLQIEQRIRIEQQFIRNTIDDNLQDDYSLTHRLRYQLQFVHNFKEKEGGKGNLAAKLWNEVYLTPDEDVFFDQNRLSLGILYQPFNQFSLELSYINMIQQSDPDQYGYWHVFRFTLNHLLKL